MTRRLSHLGMGLVFLSLMITGIVRAQSESPTPLSPPPGGYRSPEPETYRGQSASEEKAGKWSGGSSMGFLGSSPDGTAFAMDGNVEYFVSNNVSIGPLVQLGLTDDMTLLGLSGQGKYYIDMSGSQGRGKLVLQSGVGFTHADFRQNDTSWLVPIGLGYDYATDAGISLTAMGLVNFTNLHTGSGSGADVMPGFTFGVRF